MKTEEEVEPLPEDWSARLKELCASDVANAEVQFEVFIDNFHWMHLYYCKISNTSNTYLSYLNNVFSF